MFSIYREAQELTTPATDVDHARGTILVEYAFILILVVFVAITAVTIFGVGVLELFTDNEAKMSKAIELSKN